MHNKFHNKRDKTCQWKELRTYITILNIKTKLLEGNVNFVDTTTRQNTY